jgi:SAM-dependent methyltransferase
LNAGSASRRFAVKTINLDLCGGKEVDIQGDLVHLPLKSECIDTIICTGVLEHVSAPQEAVGEIYRVLKCTGRLFIETPFIQTVHASPTDYYRWTPDGLRQLLKKFDIGEVHVVAGPASALAWLVQQTLAMLFSGKSEFIYKIGLRIFGLLALPISWLDALLEKNPMAWRAASGFSILAVKNRK